MIMNMHPTIVIIKFKIQKIEKVSILQGSILLLYEKNFVYINEHVLSNFM